MASHTSEDFIDFTPQGLRIRVCKDGTIDRFRESPPVPPSSPDPTTGVFSKDVTISPIVSARIFLPTITIDEKLPVLVFFHGGGFCIESAFSPLYHSYINFLASRTNSLVVSVEYRLAPEHLLPAAYEDCWTGLQWVASHNGESNGKDPWIVDRGDLDRLFVGGDSAGGNIVHNTLMRAGTEGLKNGSKLLGGLLQYPYFWGSKPVRSESGDLHRPLSLLTWIWNFVYPSAVGGIDNWMVNPFAEGAPSLRTGLGCSRMMVVVAEKDKLRERGVHYVEGVKESGWRGEVDLIEIEGEDHVFDVFAPDSDKASDLMKRFASFMAD